MKTAWLNLLACSLVGALSITACKVEVGDGDGEGGEAGESSGGKTSGGANSGGKNSGGKTNGGSTSGGSASGGKANTGGSSGTGGIDAPACNQPLGTVPTSCNVQPSDELPAANKTCLACLTQRSTCCEEIAKCYSTNPNNECWYGGPPGNPGETEYLCIQSCVLDVVAKNGTYSDDDEFACAADCTRCGGVISNETSDLVACMHTSCEAECFEL